MKQLSPKQVARALGVSESSVKRWCDKGVISAHATEGGHRRILLGDLLAFVRENDYELVRPETISLPATAGKTDWVQQRSVDLLLPALLAGDAERCRQITFDLYLAGQPISAICDDVYALAFEQIGQQWECGDAEVYQERRGCEISLRVFHELRGLLPRPEESAPLAIGGASTGDQYQLPTTMAESVLVEAGWRAHSLGANLPWDTLEAAANHHQPHLLWLSVSHLDNESSFLANLKVLAKSLPSRTTLVVGGRALPAGAKRIRGLKRCQTMGEFAALAEALAPRSA